MSSTQSGSFGTLLLVVPLAAIPLMAIFGIPEFTHVAASTEPNDPGIVRQPTRVTTSETVERFASMPDDRGRAADWRAPTPPARIPHPASGIATPTPAARSPLAFRDPQAKSPPQGASPRPLQTAAVGTIMEDTSADSPHVPPAATAAGLTWRDAARKLEDVGINNYRLERGDTSNRFLFVCLCSPGNDSRIVRRFEAESTEPLQAVEDVLRQVDNWLEHRHSASHSWAH